MGLSPDDPIEPDARLTRNAHVLPALESLSTEPPAGPTIMRQAHEQALKKVGKLLKPYLKDGENGQDALRAAVLAYLEEWAQMYYRGSREAGTATERVILQIRQDTVQQMTHELGIISD